MNNIEDMQKSFEGQKFKVFSPFKCDISKNEDGNYVDDTTIFAFAWFCRGIASQAQQPDWLLKSTQDLATHLWRKHYKSESPVFEVFNDLAGVISQIDNMTTGLVRLQSQAQQEPVSQWQPIATAPKNKKIIVRYKNDLGKDRTVFAKYLDKFTEEASEGTDCETDYCEDDDTFYCKEGWVELIDNWDDFSSVYFDSRNVPTHWMPPPPAPEGDKP